jgi:hypothetical protein
MTERRLAYGLATLEAPSDDEPLTFTASSTRLNRYGFRLRTDGWRLSNYRLNPVILWHHLSFMPPIGRGAPTLGDDKLSVAVTFDRDDPFAAKVERQYRQGFLHAVSVGLDFVDAKGAPIKNPYSLTAEQIEREAFYDLAEVSAVPVPADPGAVRQHHAALAAAGMELLDFAGGQVGVEDWLRGTLNPPQLPAPGPTPTAGTAPTDDRLERMEATVGRLMDLLESTLGRALEVPAIQQALTAIGAHTTAVEDSAWDGPAAVAAMPNQAATLRYCHAWRDADGDADAKQSYKFPHHRTQGGPANLGGCRNGLARLEGSSIPDADKPGVERHLQHHLDAQSDADTTDAWAADTVQGFLAAIRL